MVSKAILLILDELAHAGRGHHKLRVPPVRGQRLLRSQISDGSSSHADLARRAVLDLLLVRASSGHDASILS